MQPCSRLAVLVVAVVVTTSGLSAQTPAVASAPDRSADFPAGWRQTGANPASYTLTVDSQVARSGRASAQLAANSAAADSLWSSSIQQIRADDYRGKRVRFRGYMKTRDAGMASLWMRVDGIDGGHTAMLAFDNMESNDLSHRGPRGTTDWSPYDIVLDIPQGAGAIVLGAILQGNGQLWVDDFSLEVVDATVRATETMSMPEPYGNSKEEETQMQLRWAAAPMRLVNPDFEGGKRGRLPATK